MIPMTGTTQGVDYLQTVQIFFEKQRFDWDNIVTMY